jgi:hypothetical protein
MRTLSPYSLASVALAALAAVVAASAVDCSAGDQPGVARISDSSKPAAEPNPLPVRTVGSSRTVYDNSVAGCPTGNYNAGACERAYPERYHDHCWLRSGKYRQSMRWDYIRGPAIHPIVREPVSYQRWLPDVWYGDPRYGVPEGTPIAPMVYMPTDTTQLGYYYQRVPTWVPKPCMIPPYPLPSRFHRIDRPATASGPCNVGSYRHGLFHHGSSCNNPRCGCRNCKCGANCGCGMENPSTPTSPNNPTPANPAPGEESRPGVPPKPRV